MEFPVSRGVDVPRLHRKVAPSDRGGAYTPPDLLKRHKLPIAAYFHTHDCPPGLDASQPLLLYRNYTSTKVRAASLQISQDSGVLAVGPTLVIPDSFTGWFSIMAPKGKTAPFSASIEEVASSRPPFFLTRYDIPAYIKEVDAADSNKFTYRKHLIQSGHVLKLLGIFEDLNHRRRFSEQQSRYIQCLNHCNQTIYVPFAATGRFYETASRGSTNVSHVFLISQILTTFKLPLTVRLVCGFIPRIPRGFTGILRLEKPEKEAVILACTITSEAKAILLEMDVASNFLLKPITDPVYMKTPIFLKSVSYCSEEADSWQRQIKVIHHVTEDETESVFRRSSNGSTISTSSLGLNLSLFGDLDKLRGRNRDKHSKPKGDKGKAQKTRDKSRDFIRSVDKNKENREHEESRSKESRLRIKVKEKLHERSKNPQYVVNGEFISIRVDDKLSGKKGYDNRKVAKQNTYIFQNERLAKYQDKKRGAPESEEIPKSIEVQEYATVLDDISHAKDEVKPEICDGQYAEICDHKVVSDSKTGIVKMIKKKS